MFLLIKSTILLRGFNNIILLLEKLGPTVKIKKIHGSEKIVARKDEREKGIPHVGIKKFKYAQL